MKLERKKNGFALPSMVVIGILLATTVAFGSLFIITRGNLQETESNLYSLKEELNATENSLAETEEKLSATENSLAETEEQLKAIEKFVPSPALPEKENLPSPGQWSVREWTRITTNPEALGYEFGDPLDLYRSGFEKASKKNFDSWKDTYVDLGFTVVEFSDPDGAKSSFSNLMTHYEEELMHHETDYETAEVYPVTLGDEAFGFFTVEEWEYGGEVHRYVNDGIIFRESNKIGVSRIEGGDITKEQALPYAEILYERMPKG